MVQGLPFTQKHCMSEVFNTISLAISAQKERQYMVYKGFYTKVYSHLLNLRPWNLIQDYCISFSKGTLWVKHKPDWEKEGKNEGVKTNWISLMITSSSTRLLWMADQVLSGKCVSVVALPKSHSLIIPLELTSRFST